MPFNLFLLLKFVVFSLAFYKKLLNLKLNMQDLELFDPQFFNSLKWISENDIDEAGMDLYFLASYEFMGKTETCELKAGGGELKVVEENKKEYINLMVDWRFSRGVAEQTRELLAGMNEVLPLQWLKILDEKELEMVLCGIQFIDTVDWKANTVYRGGFHSKKKEIKWFWKVVEESDQETRAKLLQFVCGTCRLPMGGFAELAGANGPQKFAIERAGDCRRLPRSHTCFNRLDLPPYRSFHQLKEKLLYAVQETAGFGRD